MADPCTSRAARMRIHARRDARAISERARARSSQSRSRSAPSLACGGARNGPLRAVRGGVLFGAVHEAMHSVTVVRLFGNLPVPSGVA